MKLLELFNELSLHPKNAAELKGLITKLAIEGKLTQARKPDFKALGEIIQFTKNGYSGRPNDEKVGSKRLGIETVTQSAFLEVNESLAKYIEIDDKKKEKYFVKDKDIFICRQNGNLNFVGKAAVYFGQNDMLIFSDSLIQVRPDSACIDSSYLVIFINSDIARNQIDKYCATTAGNFSVNGINLKKVIIPIYCIKEQHAIVTIVNQLFTEIEQLEQLTKQRIQLKHDFAASALQRLVQAGNINGEWTTIQQHFSTFFNEKANVKKLRETILQLAVQGKLTAHWRKENPGTEPASELLKRIAAEKQQLIKAGKIRKENPLPPIKPEEVPFELPEGWVWCRLGEICPNVSSGSTPPASCFKECGKPYLKVYNIRNQKIDFNYKPQFIDEHYHKTKLKRSILNPGDVIMNIVGPPLGKVAIIPNDYDEWNCNQAITFFKPVDKKINKWIYTYLCAGLFIKDIELIGTAGQDNISVTKSKNILMPLPCIQEQQAIVTIVNTLMGLCDTLEQAIDQHQEQAEMLMQSCLKQVIEGGEYRMGVDMGMAAEPEVEYRKD